MIEAGTIWRLLALVVVVFLVLVLTSASWAAPLQHGLRQTVPTRTPLPATEEPEATEEPTSGPGNTSVPDPTDEPTAVPTDGPGPTVEATEKPTSKPANTTVPTSMPADPTATSTPIKPSATSAPTDAPTQVAEEPTVPASTAVVMPETGEGPDGGMPTGLYAGIAALGVAGAAYVFWRRWYLARQ